MQDKLPDVRDAFSALARALQRMGAHRNAREQHVADLEPALLTLASVLTREPTVTVQVEPSTLICDGEVVYSEVARESSLCFRLHRDGVRSLTFTRGVSLEELLAFVHLSLPEAAGPGREDALTELWKADLQSISYTVVAGYQMIEEGAADDISARARGSLERFADALAPAEEAGARLAPSLLGEVERRPLETESWSALAQRTAATLLDIVASNFAGRDLSSLEETYGRLFDEVLERRDLDALTLVLTRPKALQGPHADGFRAVLGQRLADKGRAHRLLELSRRAPDLLPAWLAQLPASAGELLLDALEGVDELPARRALLAQAAVQRLEGCRKSCEQKLRMAAPDVSRALLAALQPLPPAQRALLGSFALQHRSAQVRLEALAVVDSNPAIVGQLGQLLFDREPPVRMAAAEALGGCSARADEASRLLLATIGREEFALEDRALQTTCHRALGRLRSTAGFVFLQDRLAGSKRSLLRKKRVEEEQLLAVYGLAAEPSERSLASLEEAAAAPANTAKVVTVCKAAAHRMRQQLSRVRP